MELRCGHLRGAVQPLAGRWVRATVVAAKLFLSSRESSHSSDDPVFLPTEEEREEYVRSDYGLLYMGSELNLGGRPWSFGQVGAILEMRAASGAKVCFS